ncbi:class I adenylate-forming enzyme family protein [Streptomyces sp. HD]|uniref:class I adenylate-forming enzyme family protein n=1 Tax=Streptomyces sp. HD TaxID=3020892 RepID=UPI00232BC9C4|nr:AMP-binding protein [Streptomyces sp. HD]MDC0772593.1 AMP-binding protein [Streptomyces sp. HD]
MSEDLAGLLARAAHTEPDRTAVVGSGLRWDFASLDRRADVVACEVDRLLPGGGATVAVSAGLHPDFAAAYYGVARSGNVVAVINPLLREDNLRHVLALSGARLAFVDIAVYQHLKAAQDELPELTGVVLTGAVPDDGRSGAPAPWLADLTGPGKGPGTRRTAAPADPDDVVCIQFTSGTTGRPKGVRLTHRNLVTNAAQIAAAHRLDHRSVSVNHLPTYHPMHLNSAIAARATQILCREPDPLAAVAEAGRHGATHFYSLPVRLARLAAHPDLPKTRLPTVTAIASGGSGLPAGPANTLGEHFGVPVFQGYGLAETSPLTHSGTPDDTVPGSVGRPVHGTECRIVGVESRSELPAGETGEIQVRGPQVMKGYLGGPDGAGLERDGWFSTGDVGRLDEDGRLFLVDRLKDIFKCDNFLVSPSEIELVLLRDPRVLECAVVELPDASSGAVAGALVALRPEALADGAALADVIEDVNDRVPYYQRLRHAEAVEALPRSANGKIQRRDLGAALAGRLGLG